MKHKIVLLFLLFLGFSIARAQQPQKRQYVVAPDETVFLAVAAQPECPLKIENARMLLSVDNTYPIYQYRLVNRGIKPIHYFTVVAWHSGGTGGTLGNPAPWDGRITNRLIMPGRVLQTGKLNHDVQVVPLTSEVRTKLSINGSLKAITVLLVDHITFADGSTYDNRKASEALVSFFEKLDP
jgi:hypothetical protein